MVTKKNVMSLQPGKKKRGKSYNVRNGTLVWLLGALLWPLFPQPVADVSNFLGDVSSACGKGQISKCFFSASMAAHTWPSNISMVIASKT